jgi:hypothetical protein
MYRRSPKCVSVLPHPAYLRWKYRCNATPESRRIPLAISVFPYLADRVIPVYPSHSCNGNSLFVEITSVSADEKVHKALLFIQHAAEVSVATGEKAIFRIAIYLWWRLDDYSEVDPVKTIIRGFCSSDLWSC